MQFSDRISEDVVHRQVLLEIHFVVIVYLAIRMAWLRT